MEATDRLRKYLDDIVNAIDNIQITTNGLSPQSYQKYEVSWVVERGIEIIAEALKRCWLIDGSLNISHKQQIIATRNKITHEYDVIDNYDLYVIVTKYLPLLKNEVLEVLDNL